MNNSIRKAVSDMPEYIERLRRKVEILEKEKTGLLEALSNIANISVRIKDGETGYDIMVELTNAITSAREAIAKAKGE